MTTTPAQASTDPQSRTGKVSGYQQSGITNRPPGHLLLVALMFRGDRSPQGTRQTLESLREVVRKELRSDLDELNPSSPKEVPSPETGELGFEDGFNRDFLTITLGISFAGFEALGVPVEERPADLVSIPWGKLGDSPDIADSGDLILQICSDNVYVNEHVVRRIEEELGERLGVVWVQMGVQRFTSRAGRTSRREGRALIGFHDGTSNLHPRHNDQDSKLVFVEPGTEGDYPPNPSAQSGGYPGSGPSFPGDLRSLPGREPDWTVNGTYMVVRASVNEIARWDDVALGEQEKIIGRFKFSGASLDLQDNPQLIEEEPAFAHDQSNVVVPLNAHTRKTNPRRDVNDDKRRIYRRGYSLVQATPEGLQRGLVFICFGRTISTQFEFIVRAWMNNADFPTPGAGLDRIREFDQKVICGGYYFVPPREHKTQPWSWRLHYTGSE